MSTQRKKIMGVYHIRRAAYTRGAYTRSDGTRVKATRVPGSWIVDRGNPGKGPTLIQRKAPGSLTKYGYHLNELASKRHNALNKAVRAYGRKKTTEKVNALSVFFKNTSPKYASAARADKSYLRRS